VYRKKETAFIVVIDLK